LQKLGVVVPSLDWVFRFVGGDHIMAKFLIQATYSVDGLRALKKEHPLTRMAAVKEAVASIGGKLEAMYWALGEDEAILILEMPDSETAAALSVHVGAAGLVRTKTTRLLNLKDMEDALTKEINYRTS
jgi:uncharacterized protein with GYD domain